MRTPSPQFPLPRCIILVGASTGGTRVLEEIIGQLPPLPAAMVIVQHMPKFINDSFVSSLSLNARAEIRLAQDGDCLREGLILIAPSGMHCSLISNYRIYLESGAQVNYVCPSIDVLMQSVCKPAPQQLLIGVLLTGMGRDGAAGMSHIKNMGGLTIAQDRNSSAVYGMPAEAVKLGCIDAELPPKKIAQLLENQTTANVLRASVMSPVKYV
jgi:two-component system, chemotaxis family, protein-glutamate methylesterase/glutaminase